jgi:hypothetical protein
MRLAAYADNELNSCPTCQAEGKLLADRGLSRLLKSDGPKALKNSKNSKPLAANPRNDFLIVGWPPRNGRAC